MKEKTRIAIVGFGGAGQGPANLIQEYEDLELVAIADTSKERRMLAEERFGVRTYSDYRKMLKEEKIDILCNKTPNFLHAEVAVEALKANCHVFSEKPVGMTRKEIAEMLKAEKESGRYLQINFEMRYSKISHRIKEIIDAGEIGEPKNLLFTHMCGGTGFVKAAGDWRADPDKVGGYYIEEGCHRLDLMRYYFNQDIEDVEAVPAPSLRGPENWHRAYKEPACTLCFFPDGKLGTLITMQHRAVYKTPKGMEPELGHEYGVSIAGSEGSLKTDFWRGYIQLFQFRGEKGETYLNKMESYPGVDNGLLHHDSKGFLRDFIDRTNAGKKPMMSAFDSWKTMACVFACEESVRNGGKRIKVDYTLPKL